MFRQVNLNPVEWRRNGRTASVAEIFTEQKWARANGSIDNTIIYQSAKQAKTLSNLWIGPAELCCFALRIICSGWFRLFYMQFIMEEEHTDTNVTTQNSIHTSAHNVSNIITLANRHWLDPVTQVISNIDVSIRFWFSSRGDGRLLRNCNTPSRPSITRFAHSRFHLHSCLWFIRIFQNW